MRKLTTRVLQNGLAIIKTDFVDESGASIVPESVTWKLFNESGEIINSRSAVSVTPASTVYIALQGDDLPFSGSNADCEYYIYLRIDAPYASSLLGETVANAEQVKIPIEADRSL